MSEFFMLMSLNTFPELLYDYEGCYKVDIFITEENNRIRVHWKRCHRRNSHVFQVR